MTIVAAVLAVALVLTLVFGKGYIDSIREERLDDAYERGWSNGYSVGSRIAKADMTLDASQPLVMTKKPKKKSVKKITSKES